MSKKTARPFFRLPIKTFTLANGLTVVVQTDKTVPVVAVSLTYRVGSQDETPGRSGFAHLFEHLMFQGTENLQPNEISRLIEANGGVDNAYTMKTNTTYHEIVPRSALRTILWAEADRMRRLDVNARALAVEQEVVVEEMRQSVLNKPYRKAMDAGLAEAAFSKWANRHTTIGEMEDIRGATLADVQAFYKAHYAPNNAVLALAGDVSLAEARELAKAYFAPIPRRRVPRSPDLREKPLRRAVRKIVDDPLAKMPLIVLGWHAPPRGGKDFWALTALMNILGGDGEENPLYQVLVKKTKLALSTQGFVPFWAGDHAGMKGPDLLLFAISAKNGVTADKIVSEIDGVLKRFARQGPAAAELTRAKTRIERDWLDGLQFLMDRAQTLSSYTALIGAPGGLERDLRKVLSVSAADVRRAVGRLGRGRVIMEVRPGKPSPPPEREKPREIPAEVSRPRGQTAPAPESARPIPIPKLHRLRLGNGLQVVLVEDRRLPLIEMRLILKAGKTEEAPGQEGLSEAVQELLLKGSDDQDGAAIAESFARLGFEVALESKPESLVLGASGLARNAEAFSRELGSLLAGASYPEDETDLWKENKVQELEILRSNPGFLSDERMRSELFPGHPYRKGPPDEGQIAAATSRGLREFHRARVIPAGATLVVVGDLEPRGMAATLERALSLWSGAAARTEVPPLPPYGGKRVSLVDRPGSRQASLSVAQTIPITTQHAHYMAVTCMNHILGGTANSRLFENLRTQRGYTYGAYSSLEAYGRGLVWSADAEVRNEVVGPALEEIFNEIRRMREGVVAEETLAVTKRCLSGLFLLRLAALDRMANYFALLEQQGRDPAVVMADFIPRLEALTPQDVAAAARAYLDPASMVTVVVGERSALKDSLPA